ncbi:MAG: hypothetical protein QGG83_01360, partial [Candidatus Woesearchaeota archaeon]|nr:hypothetical protein [Candidatus Woesearchaeota archaeon]
KILGEAVFNFNKGVDKRAQANNALRIIDKYFRDGAKLAILACTEFAVMCADQEIPSIDTIEVLVDVVIREFKMLKKH